MTEVDHPIYGRVSVFDETDTISRAIIGKHEWERDLVAAMARHVTDGTDVVDAGANLGFSTLGLFAHGARPTCVHCFEPQPDVHAMLQRNTRHLEHVRTYAFALSADSIDLHGYVQVRDNIGGTRLGSGSRNIVMSTSLDELERRGIFPRRVSVMKVDVETHESKLLDGARTFLDRHRPVVFVEIVDDLVSAVTIQLKQLGYALDIHLGGWDYVFVPCTRPLLGLSMIIKNEAHGIAETLATFAPHIDRWTILDTGSTDGTQDIVRRVLADVAGELYEEPFVDFATSRNRALDLHGESTTFVIMPDADDRLIGDPIRVALVDLEAKGNPEDAYLVGIRRGNLSYQLPLVTRSSARCRYLGVVHEHVACPRGIPTVRLVGVVLTQTPRPQSVEASRARWHRDLALLLRERERDPADPRTSFYLAQTYECLDEDGLAIAEYRRRVELGGWRDETFEALRRIPKALARRGEPWALVLEAHLAAHAFDPRRAEPLHEIAQHHHDRSEHALAYLFARRATELPMPTTSLFIDAEVYEHKACALVAIHGFYLDEAARIAGKDAATCVVAVRPDDELARSNRAFYAPSARALFKGYTSKLIAYTPVDRSFVPTNPSVHFDGHKWRCNIRLTNYRLTDGHYRTEDGGPIRTENVLAILDDDLNIVHARMSRDIANPLRSDYPVRGYEDLRLFSWHGRMHALGLACDLAGTDGAREQCLLVLNDVGDVMTCEPLRGPWDVAPQKNWMPFANGDDVTHPLVYSADPLRVFDLGNGVVPRDATSFEYGRMRGGSQIVRIGDGLLFLVHEVTFSGPGHRTYLHRFVMLDNDATIVIGMTESFYFEKMGIEFCAGLAYDDRRLVVSFGIDDRVAYLGLFDVDAVISRLDGDTCKRSDIKTHVKQAVMGYHQAPGT